MKKFITSCLGLGCLGIAFTSRAIDLKESKITQVVNDVEIISTASQAPKTAVVNDPFSMPDILRTGAASRAELVAKDETVTRVGADTIFAFDPASRTIDLKQGSLLFHSPHGKGGGTIHTGSATASVLGTTLIVTTTPNGGMKVLDLEGKVEVNFPNKKKQKLLPGQMTFILPGGSQLAPIIVFRLDELIRHSLLVQGFGHPLTSLPLIQNEIDHQTQLIKSGKVSDTGLLVGDSATANQVEVLDPNTIQKSDQSSGSELAALRSDATLVGSSLDDPGIPTPPQRVFLDQPFSLAGNKFFAGQTFRGFAGNNISFSSLGVLNMDMSTYADNPVFDFVAAKIINLGTSVTFSGLSSQNQLFLIGGSGILVASGVNLSADVGDFELSTPGALTMNGGSIVNSIGTAEFVSGSTITLNNYTFAPAGLMTIKAPQAVNLTWDGPAFLARVGAADYNSIITNPKTGHVNISSINGSLSVQDTSIQAHFLTLNSGDTILLDASGQTLKASGKGSIAGLTAPNLITVNSTDFSSYGAVNMAANTIVLTDVNFGGNSQDNLTSANHALASNPNTDRAVTPGDVNFIHGVTYGGVLVSAPADFVNGNIPGTGITIK